MASHPNRRWQLYARAFVDPNLEAKGLAVHIGSQIRDLAPLEAAFGVMRGLVERCAATGWTSSDWISAVAWACRISMNPIHLAVAVCGDGGAGDDGLDIALAFEPGRMIAGNAGVLVSRVIRIQERPQRPILVLDAGMNDLLRPAMYDAFHEIRPLRQAGERAKRSMWSARFAKPATPLRATACWRLWGPAIWWRS